MSRRRQPLQPLQMGFKSQKRCLVPYHCHTMHWLTALLHCCLTVLCLHVSLACSAGVYVRSMLECNAASHQGTTFTMTKYRAHNQQLPANNISLGSVITLHHRESHAQLVMEAGRKPSFRKQVLTYRCQLPVLLPASID